MKMLKHGAISLAVLLTVSVASAQKVKLIEGDLSAIKNEKTINTEFTYENMKVGKFDKESEYVEKKTEEYNKKEAGRGDTWAKRWVDDREQRFQPKFNELFEKASGMTVSPKAKYTLIYKTTFLEPGFNIGVANKPAQNNGEAWIVETANKDKVIAKITVTKAPGTAFFGNDYDTGVRLTESYATAGRGIGRIIAK